MIASITELNLKNFISFLKFIPHAVKSHRKASNSPGIISVSVKSKGLLIQRTLTVWADEKAMKDFVRSDSHLNAMKVFPKIANTSYTAHFEVLKTPTWDESLEYLKLHGRKLG